MVTIRRYIGPEVLPFISDVAQLRIEVFAEFPYLYDGDLAYEENYLKAYAESPESLFVLVQDGADVVGVSTGIPLKHAEDAFRRPFQNIDIPVEDVFYFGESILRKPFRGHGMGTRFFEERERYAREKKYEWTAFCAVERDSAHPARPDDFQPLNAFWGRRGYLRRDDLQTELSWKEQGEETESAKPMTFWMRRLR